MCCKKTIANIIKIKIQNSEFKIQETENKVQTHGRASLLQQFNTSTINNS